MSHSTGYTRKCPHHLATLSNPSIPHPSTTPHHLLHDGVSNINPRSLTAVHYPLLSPAAGHGAPPPMARAPPMVYQDTIHDIISLIQKTLKNNSYARE